MDGLTHYAIWVLVIFAIGYLSIILEELIRVNKASTALIMSILCWTILFAEPNESVERHLNTLSSQMFKVSQVLFFLMGALTIVEIINVHKGFHLVTEFLYIQSKRKLLWAVGFITFFMSSVLDNLTTTIVMVSLINKLLSDREDRLVLGGAVVIAANAGGAWTPIGDVATTLLWINGQVSTLIVMRDLFFPSLVCLLIPILLFSKQFTGKVDVKEPESDQSQVEPGATAVFFLGVASLIFVPFFKIWTNLPPFMGMMLALGFLWVYTDLLHFRDRARQYLRVPAILPRVDMTFVFFYLGILLSINALESAGLLKAMAYALNQHTSNPNLVAISIGLLSSIVDNVSLVAATIGMYDLKQFSTDSTFWQLIAYCAGTGGSILIIGSAAGVAYMALEKTEFIWYAKKIAPKALAGYFAGIGTYFLIYAIF